MSPLQKGQEAIFHEYKWVIMKKNDIKNATIAYRNSENTPKEGLIGRKIFKTEYM